VRGWVSQEKYFLDLRPTGVSSASMADTLMSKLDENKDDKVSFAEMKSFFKKSKSGMAKKATKDLMKRYKEYKKAQKQAKKKKQTYDDFDESPFKY